MRIRTCSPGFGPANSRSDKVAEFTLSSACLSFDEMLLYFVGSVLELQVIISVLNCLIKSESLKMGPDCTLFFLKADCTLFPSHA